VLPLAASDLSTFYAALAVAGAHWANRIQLGAVLTEQTTKQVELLKLASEVGSRLQSRVVGLHLTLVPP